MRNPQDVLPALQEIIQEAGHKLLTFFRTPLQANLKSGGSIVTQADIEIEKFLMQKLHELLPEAGFFAEETGVVGKVESQYTWVIDPLDGTSNFYHHIPYFCISIALTYQDQPLIGVIYAPYTKELFYGYKDGGCWMNGQRCPVVDTYFTDQMVLVGFPYDISTNERLLEDLKEVFRQGLIFRHLGAIALDQAYVAAGYTQALFFEGLAWWDVAAGALLLKESGNLVTTYDGGLVGPDYTSFLAAKPKVHAFLQNLLLKK